jgi:hypothetical protein
MAPDTARPLTSPIQPLFVLSTLLSRHQGDCLEDMGSQRLLRVERQPQMMDDPVDNHALGQ